MTKAEHKANDSSSYQARPPAGDEFSTDEEHLAWDGEGWENVGEAD
jgi:hypothetical protein